MAMQLSVPAALYLAVHGDSDFDLRHLLPNYLFMALPLLLVALLAIWPRTRRPALLWLLSLLNVLLVAFQVWILLAVPRQESGLAWLFYIPLWISALLAFAIVWRLTKRKGIGQPIGT